MRSKEEYIRAWDDNIDNLNILAFCPNKKHHEEVIKIRDRLKQLVREIAKTKKLI